MRKRVLFLAHSALNGGAEFCLDTTLRHLNREKTEPFVIFPTDGPMADSARKMGIPVEIIPLCWWMLYEPSFWEWKNRLKMPWRLHFLKNFIRKHTIQCVYTNTICTFEGVLAAKALHIPHITHVHEVLKDRYMHPRWYSLPATALFYYRNSKKVIFESEEARNAAEKQLRQNRTSEVENLLQKSVVISNSSRFSLRDYEEYRGKSAAEIASEFVKYGFQENRTTFLWVGRFSERKNPHALVRAVKLLPETVRGTIQVLFAGAGPLEESLKNVISAENVENTCKILPFQEDIRPLLRLADALILTSREESFGLVLAEAGIFALPVAAMESQGPLEIIENEKTGLLIPQENAEPLSQALLKLALNNELRKEMGIRNQLRVLNLYNPVQNTEKIEHLF